MNTSRFPILSLVGLLVLLSVLGTLQYRWLGEISAGERERMQKRLETDTRRFAEDFNSEIRNAYFTFQIDPGDWLKKDWKEFNNRYDIWLSKTKYPQLIEDVYFVGKDSAPLRYSAKKQEFEPVEWTGNLSEVRDHINRHQKEHIANPPVLDSYTLLMGNYAQGKIINDPVNVKIKRVEPELSGYLVIKLDEKTVSRFISDLAARYFSDSETSSYNLSIFRKSDSKFIYQSSQTNTRAEDASDAVIEIFDVTNESFRLIVNSRVFSKRKNIAGTESGITENAVPPIPKMDKSDTMKVFFDDKTRNEREVKYEGLWLLKVQHTDGSLEQFITKTRRRNLAVSFGILSLLAASGILILVSAQRAKSLAQTQMDFVSAVSHEFRTPLAVIYTAGENLMDGVVNSEKQVAQYGSLIKREGKKLSAMVEQILEFAGARSGRRQYDFRETDVKAVIEKALNECQSLISDKGIVVDKEIADNLPKVSADENALTHAIQNLITNAVKYSNGYKWIKVSAVSNNGQIKIEVEDKGIGIAVQDVAKIFTPFYRAKSVVEAQIHGNGLGLSLVKQTIEAHGGKIFVETESGKGSRFIIHLPLNI